MFDSNEKPHSQDFPLGLKCGTENEVVNWNVTNESI